MTLAEKLLAHWQTRTTTFPVIDLAKKLDPKVRVTREHFPFSVQYDFTDGSRIRTEGRGGSFKVWRI